MVEKITGTELFGKKVKIIVFSSDTFVFCLLAYFSTFIYLYPLLDFCIWSLFIFLIEVQLIYNVVLSIKLYCKVIHYTYMHFFQIIFPYKSLYNTEYGFLPYTVGPWSLLYIWYSVCVNPKPLIHPYPLTFHFGIQKLVFCVYASISVLYILLFASASMVAQTVKPLPAKRRPRFNP